MKKAKSNNLNFFLISFLTIIIFVFGMMRDIDLNGENTDDKLTMYVYAVSQNVDSKIKEKVINDTKRAAVKKCSLKYECVNRLEMQISQNNNYPINSWLINFLEKHIISNNDENLIKISKSVHYSLIISQILFFSFFLIFAFYSTKFTQNVIVIFLLFIVLIDKKILNINLLSIFPFWSSINLYTTEHMPRGIALFSGILSMLFFYLRYYKSSSIFCFVSLLFHFTFGIVLLILLLFFYLFDKIVSSFNFSQEKKYNFFFSVLIISIVLINKLSLLLVFLPCYLIIKKTKNVQKANFIFSLLFGITFIVIVFTFENFLNRIVTSNQHYIYLQSIFNFLNIEYFINLFSFENIRNLNESYFMYYLRHGPSRFYPLLLSSLVIIIIIESNNYFLKKINIEIKKLNFYKYSRVIILIALLSFSPMVLDRLIYFNYVFKNIPNDLLLGIKKEGTYEYVKKIEQKLILPKQFLNMFDFKNKENLSFYILAKIYLNEKNEK